MDIHAKRMLVGIGIIVVFIILAGVEVISPRQ